MERFLEEGRCDGFILGRSILADPELPEKARTGREADIHQCLRCYACNNAQYIERGRVLHCSINPTAGRELRFRDLAPLPRRKIVVVYGGFGGMVAALTAARRGHEVVLYEVGDALGGLAQDGAACPFQDGHVELYSILVPRAGPAAGHRPPEHPPPPGSSWPPRPPTW